MTEYIDREKVRDEFYQCVLDGTITSVEDTGKFLRDFPGADVAPVVHGEWVQLIHHVEFEDGFVDRLYECCSRCHEPNGRNTSNYCPNCGAHMKDGE